MSCETCQSIPSIEERLDALKKRIILANSDYVASLKKSLKDLKKLMEKKNRDRLDNTLILFSMVSLMKGSIEGWIKWCNVQKIHEEFDNNEKLEVLINEMSELVFKWIETDIRTTEEEIKRLEKELKNKIYPKKSKSKKSYVA